MSQSAALASPFASAPPLDDDLHFVCLASAVLGPFLANWRQAQMQALESLAKALRPWELDLLSHEAPSVAAVASDKRPAFLAVCGILLRWPDVANPFRFVSGYTIVGDIEVSHLFRPLVVDDQGPTGLDVLLGDSAAANFPAMLRRVGPS